MKEYNDRDIRPLREQYRSSIVVPAVFVPANMTTRTRKSVVRHLPKETSS